MSPSRPRSILLITVLLGLGLFLRCINLGFGLPAFYDPDEPLFVLKAYELLDQQTLNPRWFGHPGTTTIYLLALVDVVVVLTGLASGRFADLSAFAAAVYADPGLIMLPSRFVMACIGTATIALVYLIGSRLFDRSIGAMAGLLLALNALHISWSQVIRTDIHSSLFMLASLLFAIKVAEGGRSRDVLLSGLFAGLAMATKWPAGTVLVASAGAILYADWRSKREVARQAMALIAATIGGLFVGSPFVFLDWTTMLTNISGEVVSGHLGHSGRGPVGNLLFYMAELQWSMGWLGLALVLAGSCMLAMHRLARVTILPLVIVYLGLLSAQPQIWSRWLTPVVPLFCLAAAVATLAIVRALAGMLAAPRRSLAIALGGLAVVVPSAFSAAQSAQARGNDTRDQASSWAKHHLPAGSRIVVEHLALNLRDQPWSLLFPLGSQGCIDGRRALTAGVDYENVQQSRGKSPIIDLGSIPADKVDTCRADYAILTYYDLYLAEKGGYPAQIEAYQRLLSGGRTVALFVPDRTRASGPITRIVALRPQ